MYIPNTINENTITMILGNSPKIIGRAHINFLAIKEALRSGKYDLAKSLLNVVERVEQISSGDFSIVDGEVRYQGRLVPEYQATKLITMMKENRADVNPLKNFIARLMANESSRAREEFAKFADYKQLPFDADGFVYAYKGVQESGYSVMGNKETRILKGKVDAGGHILNENGAEIECVRADVDDDCNRTCSHGLHAGSFDYASGWGARVKLVKFDPADVVSVPTDCNGQKCRLCHYWVVSDYVADTDIKRSVITDEVKPKNKKVASVEDYRNYFVKILGDYNLNYMDKDLIESYMDRGGYTNSEIIEDLCREFEIASKINRYVDRKGGQTSLKKIQSAMKSYRLKFADIQFLVNTYGKLT